MKNRARMLGVCVLSALVIISCGGGSSATTSDTGDDTGGGDDTSGTTITLSGQVAVADTDLSLSALPAKTLAKARATLPKFKTIAKAVLPEATVSLYKVLADGTEEVVAGATATTDASGNYTIADVPVATGGTGAATDFYYEVRAASGDLEVIAPVAPEADTTVDVSPETHLAAKMLTDVVNVAGDVLPRLETIENLRDLTKDELTDTLADSVAIPSLGNAATLVIAATAIGANNGNAEKALRTYEAEKEMLVLDAADATADAAEVGSYLERVTRQGCDFNTSFNLPETVREAMAESFIDDATVTPSDIVTAYNANNGGDPEKTADGAVTDFGTILSDVETAIAGGEDIATADQGGMFVKRELSSDTFATDTAMDIDQAVAFAQQLFPTPCQPGSFDSVGFVSDLTGVDIAPTPSIVDFQLYQSMDSVCNSGPTTRGRLNAEVQVYAAGGAVVNGVTISRDDNAASQALAQNGGANGAFSRWRLSGADNDVQANTEFFCVDLPSEAITYTITVDLGEDDPITETVTRTHVLVPEANISVIGEDGEEIAIPNENLDPGYLGVPVKRPVFKWSPAPGTPSESVVANAPEGSKIKFVFELSYQNLSDQVAQMGQCGSGGSANKLMDRNYFIANVDCDTAACAALVGLDPDDVLCRTNVQTYLVDENDRFLGQAAGNFRRYCYDADDDGICN